MQDEKRRRKREDALAKSELSVRDSADVAEDAKREYIVECVQEGHDLHEKRVHSVASRTADAATRKEGQRISEAHVAHSRAEDDATDPEGRHGRRALGAQVSVQFWTWNWRLLGAHVA